MPTYAYACTACEHRFEVQQAFSDASLTECPECAGRLRKLFNAVGIVFKGSGFYRTDSRSGSSSSAPSSAATSDKPADKPAEKKAEKKAEPAASSSSASSSSSSSSSSGSPATSAA